MTREELALRIIETIAAVAVKCKPQEVINWAFGISDAYIEECDKNKSKVKHEEAH